MISEGLASQGAQEDRLRGQHGPDEPMHTPRKVDHIVAAWTTSRRIEAIAHGSVMMSSDANQMPNSARVSSAARMIRAPSFLPYVPCGPKIDGAPMPYVYSRQRMPKAMSA